MSQLFMSSGKKKDQQVFILQNLSPEKYGKAAYASLTYTPSKLADNVLFKELSNQKKLQQEASKLRQTETYNSIIKDRLAELYQQKQGIQKTLSEQIAMYKKMLKEKQEKNEKRIKLMQQSFNDEIKSLLGQKQQEAKFSQSEKQLLEEKISSLGQINKKLSDQIEEINRTYDNFKSNYQKLQILSKESEKREKQAQINLKKNEQKFKQQIQGLKRNIYQNSLQNEKRLQKQMKIKEKQIESIQKLHKNELEKIESKRGQEILLKNQQLKDLASTFQKEAIRLNGTIAKKQEQLIQMGKTIEMEKQKTFGSSKKYENQITALAHEKTRLKEELIKAERKFDKIVAEHQELQNKYHLIKEQTQQQTSQLQKDLELNQIHFIKEIDRLQFTIAESTKEIARLKLQNQQASSLREENSILNREVRNMKELLLQSSDQMQRCKEQFIKICRQKDILWLRLRQLGLQNETLYLIKNSREQQARSWRDSYLIHKSKY